MYGLLDGRMMGRGCGTFESSATLPATLESPFAVSSSEQEAAPSSGHFHDGNGHPEG